MPMLTTLDDIGGPPTGAAATIFSLSSRSARLRRARHDEPHLEDGSVYRQVGWLVRVTVKGVALAERSEPLLTVRLRRAE